MSWLVAHFGYGTAFGALNSLLRRRLPVSSPVAGLAYGAALWAGSYLGAMPALDLYPPPEHDRPSRTAAMIVARGVYGLALAAAEHRMGGRPTAIIVDLLGSLSERLRSSLSRPAA